MIRILIADDHAILRRGLQEILIRELDGIECGDAENGEQVLEQAQSHDWDLVILDISMPGPSGLDVLSKLRDLRPRLPVLVLSMHSEDQYGKRVLKAGAAGYMKKESAPAELIKAIRRILAGGRYVSQELAERLAVDLHEPVGVSVHERLSGREFEVLLKIASGKTVSQIADEMHLGVPTISTYRSRILEKMGMSTNAELMYYAMHNHLVY